MGRALFEVDLVGGRVERAYTRALRSISPDVDTEFPWAALDPKAYEPELLELARLGWTENAFNEFCTATAMGQLLTLMGEANVPLDLWGLASTFPLEELLHVHLCGRVAMQLGGGMPIVYDTDDLTLDFEEGLTPLQKVNEMVIRLCCVGEVFSLPMLTGSMHAATNELTEAVLRQIVRDESMHGTLGWMYLDWIGPRLDDAERQRLSAAAQDTAAGLRRSWKRLRVRPEGAQLPGYSDIGWMEPLDYLKQTRTALQQDITGGLAKYGIEVNLELPDIP
jgi:hypothetical protein